MVFRVIDTILFQSTWTHRYPEFAARSEGVMAILDPSEITEAPEIQGALVTISKLDGTSTQVVALSTEAHHSVVGIFFASASKEDIPQGAELKW
jgi:hypothetical protein